MNSRSLQVKLKGKRFYFSGNNFFFLPRKIYSIHCLLVTSILSAGTDVLPATLCAQLPHMPGSQPPAISLQGHRGSQTHTTALGCILALFYFIFFCRTLSSLSKAQLLDRFMPSQLSSMICLCKEFFFPSTFFFLTNPLFVHPTDVSVHPVSFISSFPHRLFSKDSTSLLTLPIISLFNICHLFI